MSTIESIAELAPTFIGQLLQPADGAYDDARSVHNGLVDNRPALIAPCLGTADVADAVKLARTLNLEVAVPRGPQRRLHRDNAGSVRSRAVADVASRDRAFSRGGQPRAGDGHGMRHADHGL